MDRRLEVRNLAKTYTSPRGDVDALGQVTFSAQCDEFVALVGPSGCGKSTLLRLIAGLLTPDVGEIVFPGWPALPKRRLVFQDSALFPWLSLLENVAFGLEMEGVVQSVRRERALRQLDQMGIAEFAEHYPHELSGGMRQRGALARALVTEPHILLMDEPFRSLDAQTRLIMQEELLRLWSGGPQMVVFVTHDIEEALLLGDRVLVMSGRPGRILTEINVPLGRPRDLTGRSHPEIEELRWQIWKMLESAVRLNPDAQPAAKIIG